MVLRSRGLGRVSSIQCGSQRRSSDWCTAVGEHGLTFLERSVHLMYCILRLLCILLAFSVEVYVSCVLLCSIMRVVGA
jgi:hypothetical protein